MTPGTRRTLRTTLAAAGALFAVVLAVLAIQVRSGDDPALAKASAQRTRTATPQATRTAPQDAAPQAQDGSAYGSPEQPQQQDAGAQQSQGQALAPMQSRTS